MRLFFYHKNGRPEMGQQFYAPGKSYFDQNSQIEWDFKHVEGDQITYHVEHGVHRTYVVDAIDKHTALLRQI